MARVIKRLGGDVSAIYSVGGATGRPAAHAARQRRHSKPDFCDRGGNARRFLCQRNQHRPAYRFILPGPQLSESEWQECLRLLSGIEPFPRFVVASGSLPGGVPDDFYARVARIAKQRGARMILDTSGQALGAAVAEGVDLIKPNLREMRELAGFEPSDAKEWEAAARALVHSGKVAVIALTMGHLGAVLVTRDQVLRAQPLAITPVSAVGAGDSFLGALIWRLGRNWRRSRANPSAGRCGRRRGPPRSGHRTLPARRRQGLAEQVILKAA